MQTTDKGQTRKLMKSIAYFLLLFVQYVFALYCISVISLCFGTLIFGYIFADFGELLPIISILVLFVSLSVFVEYRISFWKNYKVMAGRADGDIKSAKKSIFTGNLVIIITALIFSAAAISTGVLTIKNQINTLKAEGLPVSYKDLYKGSPLGVNAAPELDKLVDNRIKGFDFDSRWFVTDGMPDTLMVNMWTQGQKTKVKALLKGRLDVSEYKKIIDNSDYYRYIDFSSTTLTPFSLPTPKLGGVLEYSKLLELDAKARLIDGDIEGALANHRILVKSFEFYRGEETLISNMVSFGLILNSTRILYAALNLDLADKRVMTAYSDYDRFLETDIIQNALKVELAGAIEMYRLLSRPRFWKEAGPVEFFVNMAVLPAGVIYPNFIFVFEYFNELIRKGLDASFRKNASLWPYFIGRPNLDNYRGLYSRQTETRFLVKGVKILKNAKDYYVKKGIYPLTAEDLVGTGTSKELLVDPLSSEGEMIKFKMTEDGLVIYSVGMNGKDDGGDLGNKYGSSGNDVGFILWYK